MLILNVLKISIPPSFCCSGSPETPELVSVSNSTANSMTITWQPGFSGGLAQSFKLRFRPRRKSREGYGYQEVLTPTQFNVTITGLEADTEYELSLLAFNDIGKSNYSEPIFERTIGKHRSNVLNYKLSPSYLHYLLYTVL